MNNLAKITIDPNYRLVPKDPWRFETYQGDKPYEYTVDDIPMIKQFHHGLGLITAIKATSNGKYSTCRIQGKKIINEIDGELCVSWVLEDYEDLFSGIKFVSKINGNCFPVYVDYDTVLKNHNIKAQKKK